MELDARYPGSGHRVFKLWKLLLLHAESSWAINLCFFVKERIQFWQVTWLEGDRNLAILTKTLFRFAESLAPSANSHAFGAHASRSIFLAPPALIFGPSRVGDTPTQKTKMRKEMRKIWGKMIETTGNWGQIEEMFCSCPPGSERLATALIASASWNLLRLRRKARWARLSPPANSCAFVTRALRLIFLAPPALVFGSIA